MNTRLTGSGSLGRPDSRRQQEEADRSVFADAVKKTGLANTESFISQVAAARQPPPLAVSDILPEPTTPGKELFRNEVAGLAANSLDEVTGDLAEVYLSHIDQVTADGDPRVSQAFDYLGELMLQYEHIRLMRTRDLG